MSKPTSEESPWVVDETPEAIVIPESKDGSRFTADLVLWDGTYRIGDLDEEFHVLGYTNALRFMHAMETPAWRRPSRTSGISGVVKGVRWVTVHRDSPASSRPTSTTSSRCQATGRPAPPFRTDPRRWRRFEPESSHHQK